MITEAAPYNVGSATASVTLKGLSFGSTDATVTGILALADCSTASWMAATSVACIGTRGHGMAGTSGLSVDGIVGTSSAQFSFDGSLSRGRW